MDITLFEIHLDGAQFGPATIGDGMTGRTDEMAEETTPDEPGEGASAGKPRSFPRRAFRFVPVFVGFGVAAGYVASRRFRGGGAEVDVDAEPVEIEA